MTKQLKIKFIFLIFIIVSCNNKSESTKIIEKPKKKVWDQNVDFMSTYKGSGKFIPIDFSVYSSDNFFCKDTITKSGWKIEYLVKDDKTRLKDLYIRWSKGNQMGIFCSVSTQSMPYFFIPVYKGENDSHLFLGHGCPIDCQAILVLPKNTEQNGKDYYHIVDYDIKYGKIGYIPERSYSLDELEIEVADLESGTEKSVVFENICYGTAEEACIDKMKFKRNDVEISATLLDKKDKMEEKTIVEKHKIHF